ncbi:uncharacterized protein DNG_05975 [Cephalotrichum gorgonifer]|uniref:Uncharacterized protein n=1 Tax=Cephalotrichum gorgonifer TaxID=2041049 RepID=A0AAE8N1E5_9PEZI|nr:uncharacterized protein DNG_05975 [Cephalotrichum gorgonifer]
MSGAALSGSLTDEGSNGDDYFGAGCQIWGDDDSWRVQPDRSTPRTIIDNGPPPQRCRPSTPRREAYCF